MDDSTAERLAKMEAVLAHLEHQYDQLNKVVIEQGKALARIQTQQKRVADSMEAMEADRIRSTNAKPPHYQ